MHKASITTSEFFLIIGMIVISMFLYGVIEKMTLQESSSISYAYLDGIKAQLMQHIYVLDSSFFYASPLTFESNEPLKFKSVDRHTLEIYRQDDAVLLFYPFAPLLLEKEGYYRKIYLYKLYNNSLLFSSTNRYCDNDMKCEDLECLAMCADCSMFLDVENSDRCQGDGKCNVYLGENCANTPRDCICEEGYVCDVDNPLSDARGCVSSLKHEGSVCYSSQECFEGMVCYKSKNTNFGHCCPVGEVWNEYEQKCQKQKILDVLFIPVGYDAQEKAEYDFSVIVNTVIDETPLKECENSFSYDYVRVNKVSSLPHYSDFKEKCSIIDDAVYNPETAQMCTDLLYQMIDELCDMNVENNNLQQICRSNLDILNAYDLVWFVINVPQLPAHLKVEGTSLLKETTVLVRDEERKALYGKVIVVYSPSLLDQYHGIDGYGRAVALHEFGHALGFYHTSLGVCDQDDYFMQEPCCQYLSGSSLPPLNKESCVNDDPSNVMNYEINVEDGEVKEKFTGEEYLLLKSYWKNMEDGFIGLGLFVECEGD